VAEKRDILWRFLGNAKGLDRATKDAQKDLGRVEKGMKGVGKAAGLIGGVLAGAQVLQFGRDALQMAIDAEEAEAKFEEVFGENQGISQSMEEFGDMAGVADGKSQDLFGTLGNLAQNAGITGDALGDLIGSVGDVAADLSAFNNANPEEVFQNLTTAITTTERDALKNYGIAVLETEVKQRALEIAIDDGRDAASKADRQFATLTLIQEGLGKAAGAAEREQDGLAATQRRVNKLWKEFQVQLGKELLPAIEDLLPALEEMLPLLSGVAKASGVGADNFGALGRALSDVNRESDHAVLSWGGVSQGLGDTLATVVQFSGLDFLPWVKDVGEAVDDWGEADDDVDESLQGILGKLPGMNEGLAILAENAGIGADEMHDLAFETNEVTDAAEEAAIRIANIVPPDVRVSRAVERIRTRDLPSAIRQAEGFQSGGIVPGPKGQPRLITAHGGERVSGMGDTGGGGGVVINFNGVVGDPDAVAAQIADLFTRYQQTNAIPIDGLSSF